MESAILVASSSLLTSGSGVYPCSSWRGSGSSSLAPQSPQAAHPICLQKLGLNSYPSES